MISSMISTTSPVPSSGTSPDFWIQFQGTLYGPYKNEAAAAKDGFRFETGEPLVNPLEK